MKHSKNTPFQLFAEIKRFDPATREVEGYCFVNEEVDGDGYKIKRSAMEAASQDYLLFPAVREMHGRSAAGTTAILRWDDKGCFITTKIVDDMAFKKVQEGVYRGFSIGANPRIMRGNEVLALDWYEVSLVDRPADPQATFAVYRAASAGQPQECFELDEGETIADVIERAALAPPVGVAGSPLVSADSKAILDRLDKMDGEIKRIGSQPQVQGRPFMADPHAAVTRGALDLDALGKEYDELMAKDWTVATTNEKNKAISRVAELSVILGK